jgi:hypothetical protein
MHRASARDPRSPLAQERPRGYFCSSQHGCISANWSRSRNLGPYATLCTSVLSRPSPPRPQGRVPASLQGTTGATRRSREQNIQKGVVVLVEKKPSKCVFRVLESRLTTGCATFATEYAFHTHRLCQPRTSERRYRRYHRHSSSRACSIW